MVSLVKGIACFPNVSSALDHTDWHIVISPPGVNLNEDFKLERVSILIFYILAAALLNVAV